MSGLRPITVITGASAGIGVELARIFARNGHELVLVARRQDRLEALADEIRVHRDEGQLLLAGHLPVLSLAIAYLLGAPSAQIEMGKGSLARVDLERFGSAPRGALRWLLPPGLAG